MFDEIVPLNPVHFLSIALESHFYKGKVGDHLGSRYQLPDLSSLYDRVPFADLRMGWNEKGLFFTIELDYPIRGCYFPDFRKGDSVELFFDTRDGKNTGFNTRFCHHFFFLFEEVAVNSEKVRMGEITKFRGEERHPLADPSSLFAVTDKKRRKTVMSLFIPAESLFGFSPLEFDRLGFTYRINQMGGMPQFFSASDEDFSIETQPYLWASLKLVKE